MERPAEQPVEQAERRRSFDVMASVDMLRFDLQRFGQVLPETRQRVYDEELSSIAEGSERAARTEFVLTRQDDDLVYFDRGSWRSYTGMLVTGNQVAHREAAADPRRQFLAEWSDRDLAVGYGLRSMEPGNVMTWTNAYPHEIQRRYGDKFMQSCGLFPQRQMGFIYRAECLADGSIVLQSQTIDGSDPEGFRAAEAMAVADEQAGMEQLVEAYDDTVSRKIGEPVHAGRSAARRGENAWQEILSHRDLITAMLDGLEEIAALDVPRPELEQRTVEHIVGAWKSFKRRLDGVRSDHLSPLHRTEYMDARQEIRHGYLLAQAQGDIKIGCGGAITVGNDSPANPWNLRSTFDAIFGASGGESRGSWKWKDGVCRVESCPTRPGRTKVGPCEVCVRCQAKFDAGEDPTRAVPPPQESAGRPVFDVFAEFSKVWNRSNEVVAKQSDFKLAA